MASCGHVIILYDSIPITAHGLTAVLVHSQCVCVWPVLAIQCVCETTTV